MTHEQIVEITIFVLAVFVGFEVISKVPTMLHTPLMSGTNAIHGIVLIGAILIAGSADSGLEQALAFVAVVFATVNVVGGFLVTDRMLEMFKRRDRPRERPVRDSGPVEGARGNREVPPPGGAA
jgi:NAD(P) transhydrogenase subunit alpha